MKVTKDKWVWMPHPAHFICSRDCKFFLATKVGKYIVSTVGEYWPDQAVRRIHAEIHDAKWYAENRDRKGDDFDHVYMKKFGFEEIGYGRKYETMVGDCIKSENACCPYVMVNHELDFASYNTAKDAYQGHLKMCRKFANK